MIRRRFLLVALLAIVVGSGAARTFEQSGDSDVIATERGALDRWIKGDPDGFLEIYADDVTYFDPSQERRVDGRAAMTALLTPLRGKIKIHRFEMLNPKVQRYGDIAVLSYNIVNYQIGADGKEHPANRWNSSAVYRRSGAAWKTIHSHFSFTKPELKQ